MPKLGGDSASRGYGSSFCGVWSTSQGSSAWESYAKEASLGAGGAVGGARAGSPMHARIRRAIDPLASKQANPVVVWLDTSPIGRGRSGGVSFRYTAAVATPTGGQTSTKARGMGSVRGSTISPRASLPA